MRVVHRYWTGPGEPAVQDLPGQVLWHDDDLSPSVVAWCDERMDHVTADDQARHRSNMVRWWLLAEHGGVWLDHDLTVHGEIPEGEWVGGTGSHACAAAISLCPEHPLALAMLSHMSTPPRILQSAPYVSGRVPLTRLAKVHGVAMSRLDGRCGWCTHDWATSRRRTPLVHQQSEP